MPVPNAITDLSQTANSNSPSGSESPITTDNYLRAHASFIALTNAALGTGTVAGFTQSESGATTRTIQAKLRESVNIDDFNPTADGTTDDLVPLTNFFNSAIANPGVPHYLNAATYATTAALPAINVSNVIVMGQGAAIHDVGPLITGTVIKYTGAAGATVQTITSTSGGSNAKVSNITYTGIGIDCNSLADYGLRILSIKDSVIDVSIANAKVYGMTLNVVASLGEAADLQRNKIRYSSRQVEYTAGGCLHLGGSATANVSMNDFWFDGQHMNVAAITEANVDNNDWWYVRTYRPPSGTATEAISWLGGTSEPVSCREERFHFLSSNLTSQAYGTGVYTVGADRIRVFCLDTGNGTPAPTVQTGASVYWNRASTPFGDVPWVTYTPTITASSGTFTSVSATGRYLQRGRIVHVEMGITITTNGTAAGAILATLPIANSASVSYVLAGKEFNLTGFMVCGLVSASSSTLSIQKYDGTYLGSNGSQFAISGSYEIA
jgi:hypothetical protein